MLINRQHTEFSLFYDPAPIKAFDAVFIFRDGDVLLRDAAADNRIPLWASASALSLPARPRHAFTQGGQRYFIAEAVADTPAPDGYVWDSVRVFRTLQPEADAMALLTARHLHSFYQTHRFCSVCGGPVVLHSRERAVQCTNCHAIHYPPVLPAVIVAIIDRDRLLLARNAHGVFRHFSLIAGFVEAGETAEQTVQREVLEEVGLHVKNIRYVASQPWGISQSLMLGFTAELDGPDAIRLQEAELAEARWFPRAEIPKNDSTTSIAFTMMERFRTGEL